MADYLQWNALQSKYQYQYMGKKQQNQKTYVTAETFKIYKGKSFSFNLNQYTKLLKAKHSEISTKQYLKLIHQYIARYAKKKGSIPQSLIVQTTSKIKICKRCDKWAMGTKKMVQCTLCQDHYHIQCAEEYVKNQDWRCSSCISIIKDTEDQAKQTSKLKNKICFKCGENKNQVSLKCLKCNNFFHKNCYGGAYVVCGGCNKTIQKKIQKQKQLTLGQSFLISSSKKRQRENTRTSGDFFKPTQLKVFGQKINSNTQQKKQAYLKQQNNQQTNHCSRPISNSKRFRAKFPEMTAQEIQSYKQKLYFAILSKNMQYDQNLRCHNCTLYDDIQDSIDFAIQQLSISDTKMFREYKKQPIGPFLLQYSQKCGYDVVADKDLPKGMIICQYVGDVYTHRAAIQLQEQNDSVMQLKIGKNSQQTLLIVPRKYTNIARFLNGVNQNDPKRKQKQNVQTIRSLVQGRPVVILYTIRAIKRGESLLYNYGAGLIENKYDTSYYQ